MPPIPIQFPLNGITDGVPFGNVPPGYTLDALNVMPFSTPDGKLRGGKRPGSKLYIADAVNGSNPIQRLVQGTTSITAVAAQEYAGPAVEPGLNTNRVAVHPSGSYVAVSSSASPYLQAYEWDDVEGFGGKVADPAELPTASIFGMAWSHDGNFIAVCYTTTLAVYAWTGSGFGARLATVSVAFAGNPTWHPDDTYIAVGMTSSPYIRAWPWTGSAFGSAVTNPTSMGQAPVSTAWSPAGTAVVCALSSTPFIAGYAWTGTGWGGRYGDPGTLPPGECRHITWSTDSGHVIVSHSFDSPFFSVYVFSSGFGTKLTNPTNIPSGTTHATTVQTALTGRYIVVAGDAGGGDDPYLAVYDWANGVGITVLHFLVNTADTFSISGLTHAAITPNGHAIILLLANGTTGLLRALRYDLPSNTIRETHLVSVAGGNIYQSDSPPTTLSLAGSGTGALDSATFRIAAIEGPPSPSDSSPANTHRFIYFADGAQYKRLDLQTATVSAWTLASGIAMPVDAEGHTARILALFRGRGFLAGLPGDPTSWFLTAQYNLRDFDYAAGTATGAIAGNNPDNGIIVAAASYGDDVLIIGGDHAIWAMQGDPGEGGRVINVSQQIGMAGADAWTRDPEGNLYFLSSFGFHSLSPDLSPPKQISLGRLDKAFSQIDYTTVRPILVWDRDLMGCWVILSSYTQPTAAPLCYWYDKRSGGFWPEKFPLAAGPTAVTVFDGDAPGDRTLLLGGWDSYIRALDREEVNDRDTAADVAIDSYVDILPSQSGKVYQDQLLSSLRLAFSDDTENLAVKLFAAGTPEQAWNSSALRWSRTVGKGFSAFDRHRIFGNAFRLRFAQNVLNVGWAFEGGEMETRLVNSQ